MRSADCYWNLTESRGEPCVCVYLEKERESWWKSALHGHTEIDTQKVDSTRDMYDYDHETQARWRALTPTPTPSPYPTLSPHHHSKP